MKIIRLLLASLPLLCFAQTDQTKFDNAKPKLIIGIVIYQMRFDYLSKYWDKYGDGGFKKLTTEGFNCINTHYNYIPTYTGPGHASIYTGTTPGVHGIIANDWHDKSIDKEIYCVHDENYTTVGSKSKAGQMSPKNLLVSTLADELRLSSNFRSKSIGISLKDRGAVLPAGFSANGAFWLDDATGNWITSSYYMDNLPDWATQFNNKRLIDKYLSESWNTLLPIESYTESTSDNTNFEKAFTTEENPTFPHNLPRIKEKTGNYEIIKTTPFGNDLTLEAAKAAITGEKLGKSGFTDFISISFSATDYVGHRFGPQSIEVEDTYLRLDKNIENLLAFLNTYMENNNYLLFLTADHGAIHTPNFLKANKMIVGYFKPERFLDNLNKAIAEKFGKAHWIESFSNDQIFLNHTTLKEKNVSKKELQGFIIEYSLVLPEIAAAISSEDLLTGNFSLSYLKLAQAGYNQKRSGDVILILSSGYIDREEKGTTHGSPFNYDTHVPLVWHGTNVKSGVTAEKINITDIVPTIAAMLRIQIPDGVSGKPIGELVK